VASPFTLHHLEACVPEPFAVVSVAEMRVLEAAAVEAGTSERVLQERAGLAVADVVEDELAASFEGHGSTRVIVLVGAGNNGRDGVVAGRRLAARGCQVELWIGPRHALSDGELRDLTADGLVLASFGDPERLEVLRSALRGSEVVIDGLLGVASRGPMRPGLAEVAGLVAEIRTAQEHPIVVAVDVPSGIDADTGEVPGPVVPADITVTFGAVKSGLLRFPAALHVGRLVPRSIGLPVGSSARFPIHQLDEAVVQPLVPPRPPDSHKYRLGRVLVIAGSDQFVGAACLGSEAAARVGAGLVGVVSTEAVKRVLATRLPEATYPLTLTEDDDQPEAAAERVAELLPDQSAMLIGPGIARSEHTDQFVRRLLVANACLDRPTPAVIDADALTLLAGWTGWWERIGTGNVLTPHAGEMARLIASDPDLAEVANEAAWETARRAAARWHQVIVLKGPFTTVAEPGGRAWVYPHANSALATAGTGDVLAGLCTGLAAQGLTPFDASRLAVVVHALGARRLLQITHRRALLASDLPAEVPAILAELAVAKPVR
jgi:NAD(P)H-hydrate epimerase